MTDECGPSGGAANMGGDRDGATPSRRADVRILRGLGLLALVLGFARVVFGAIVVAGVEYYDRTLRGAVVDSGY